MQVLVLTLLLKTMLQFQVPDVSKVKEDGAGDAGGTSCFAARQDKFDAD